MNVFRELINARTTARRIALAIYWEKKDTPEYSNLLISSTRLDASLHSYFSR